MVKRFGLLLITSIFFFSNAVYSMETISVTVLPFKIYSQKDFSYLKTEIPSLIKNQLKQEGAVIIDPEFKYDFPDSMETEKYALRAKNLAIKTGADFVIWGSLTLVDDKFSIDARMTGSYEEKEPDLFSVKGEGLENLTTALKKLTGDVVLKLFKRERVAKILIEGNRRIESDAIKRIIKTKPGDIYLVRSLSKDLKAVYSMGYFEDIRIEAENGPDGKIIIFRLKEKPTIREIHIKGNIIYEDDEIKEALNIKTGSILSSSGIKSNIKRIEELYKDKNYHNVKVTYNLIKIKQNQADLEFLINEGEKVRIKEILFEGNSAFTSKELKKQMKTSEKGFFSWLTSSGDLKTEDLSQDIANLTAFYHNNGYVQARVGEPQISYKGNFIEIRIKISEGLRFKVGKVDIEGDLILPKKELLEKIKITREEFYNREVIRKDILLLTDIYSDEGYAYADILPRIDQNLDKQVVDITYSIKKGKLVYFEKIIIAGNTKTRDKVIRRELNVYEHELYSGKRLKRGVRNLYRLDFFEDIKVNTTEGSSDDSMVLKIDVTEKPTGTFSFGGGYSTVEDLFGMFSISQKNLFGRGQTLNLKAQLGGRTNQFTLSFTEPWLFDIPLSAGFDLYNWQRDYDDYDRDSKGGSVRFGYPVFDFTRIYLSYTFEISNIDNIADYVSKEIKELEGDNTTSSLSASIRYDSRNRVFNPTEGEDHSFTVEYAGGPLGGDIGFTKFIAETGWYIPLFWSTVGFLHGKGGYVTENSGEMLPDYERFYLGGINSMRGFDWRDISALDDEGEKIGGDKFVQFNLEFIFPLIKKAGLIGLLFYDTGNVYGDNENLDLGDLRQSAGFGIRWYSPMGPIRLENGYILDPEEGESTGGKWEFSMGSAF